MTIRVAEFLDVASGLQPEQFSVGRQSRSARSTISIRCRSSCWIDRFACVLAVIGGDGRPNLTPMWFDYEDDKVLVNVATHRRKYGWTARTRT